MPLISTRSEFLANVNLVHVRYVCLSSVMFVRPTQLVEIFCNVSMPLDTLTIH